VKLAIYLPTVSVLMLLTACGDTSSQNATAESLPSQMTEHVIEEPEVVEEDGHQTEASIPADDEEGHAEPFDTGTRAQTQKYRKDKAPPGPKPAIPFLTLRAPGW